MGGKSEMKQNVYTSASLQKVKRCNYLTNTSSPINNFLQKN